MRQVIQYERQGDGRRTPERDAIVPAAGYSGGIDRLGTGSNALVMLQRVAVYEMRGDKVRLADGGRRALVRWACDHDLGQDPALVAAVARRREQALRSLRSEGEHRAWRSARLLAVPEWRLAVGLGNRASAHEIGFALHGTYGWPVIPGSSLKGLAAAWARSAPGVPPDDVQRVFGTLSRAGTVRFLDAIPADGPVTVEADVLTPHVKPYYDSMVTGSAVPPAEYHNPVPVTFLTVRGSYAVDLYGASQEDLDLAAGWLAQAGDELGAGAKTAAGYGYLAMQPSDRAEAP